MQWSDIPRRPSVRMLRQFGGLFFAFASVLAGYQALVRGRPAAGAAIAVAAAIVGAIAWLRPTALRPLFVGWMMAVFPIGWLISRVVLAVIFFGVFTPIGLLFRLVGRDVLLLRRPPASQTTYWIPKPQARDVRSYFHQF
jgi:hypothetical protein